MQVFCRHLDSARLIVRVGSLGKDGPSYQLIKTLKTKCFACAKKSLKARCKLTSLALGRDDRQEIARLELKRTRAGEFALRRTGGQHIAGQAEACCKEVDTAPWCFQ